MVDHNHPNSIEQRPQGFATTCWSLVAATADPQHREGRQALEELCARYWNPLYFWLRRDGCGHEDSQDLVQEFLAQMIEHHNIDRADPERGRFRTFLLSSLKNFRKNADRAQRTQKRGGNVRHLGLDFDSAGSQWTNEPFHTQTADRLFDRKWALQMIERSIERLEAASRERNRHELFARIKPLLAGADGEETYQAIAEEFGITAGAIKVAVHRWREQLRETIRREIRDTVLDEQDVDSELDYLIAAMS
ncbi:MAG: sigma-70 family RNA polymerase sigma factor [Pirellulaceae bacterium]|nr:sigma-70 family RNA polymerase sigma factor [Pirellulaceae bacterium]